VNELNFYSDFLSLYKAEYRVILTKIAVVNKPALYSLILSAVGCVILTECSLMMGYASLITWLRLTLFNQGLVSSVKSITILFIVLEGC
jgi:hypothetical protein